MSPASIADEDSDYQSPLPEAFFQVDVLPDTTPSKPNSVKPESLHSEYSGAEPPEVKPSRSESSDTAFADSDTPEPITEVVPLTNATLWDQLRLCGDMCLNFFWRFFAFTLGCALVHSPWLRHRPRLRGIFFEDRNSFLKCELEVHNDFPDFHTLSEYRRTHDDDFPLAQALREYLSDPICYSNALGMVARRIEEIMLNSTEYLRTKYSRAKADRQLISFAVRSSIPEVESLAMICILLKNLLRREPKENPESDIWFADWQLFNKNLVRFCKRVGSDALEDDDPFVLIKNLSEYSLNGGNMKYLLQEFYNQSAKIGHLNSMNAVLQTRHTIEKLVAQLPDTPHYRSTGAGPKWRILWDDTWKAAKEGQESNIFSAMYDRAKSRSYDEKSRDKRGKALFATMSEAIHDFRGLDIDYQNFDPATKDIVMALTPLPMNVNKDTGYVNWSKEILRYKVFYGDKNVRRGGEVTLPS
ncbi:hypothetical protein PVAG01_09020 [Phlyctema vagabunda]|uniref:Uncharacterized protein n=1 Tax=Phlyctema vagabunda TaxID=108571 RepID=A0ABR4P671_9HELO